MWFFVYFAFLAGFRIILPVISYVGCENYEQCRGNSYTKQYMYCHSDLGCADTLIYDNYPSGYHITCRGDHSCHNAVWRNIVSFQSIGALALYNVTMYASNITMSGSAAGYYSLYGPFFRPYNATFYCNNGSSCSISCNGNSCVNFDLICDATSTCSISGTRTYEVIDGAPDYYRGGLPMVDSISDTSIVTDAYNGGTYCSTWSAYGSVCKETTMTIDQSYYNLYCRATDTCRYSNITFAKDTQNSGIYCTSTYSCRYTRLVYNGSTNGNSNNNNNTVYCGSDACEGAEIIGFNTIYAMGSGSMKSSTIISNGDNNVMDIYFATYNTGSTTTIYCSFGDTCNIYCDAYLSCYQATAYCYGTCNVYCDVGVNGACITVYDGFTRSPTSVPTAAPSDGPDVSSTLVAVATTRSDVVTTTSESTEAASVSSYNNTNGNGNNENNNSNNNSTGNDSNDIDTDTDTDDDNNDNDDSLASVTASDQWAEWSKTWEIGGYVCLILSLGAPIIICILAYCFHKQNEYKYCDSPNYFAIFACFWNFGDFYSDLIFTFVLITTDNHLWYFAVFFALIPHFMSNFVSLWNIRRWQNYNIYISKYINHYDWLIIFVSVLAGFYTSVELARSKLFYLKMFSMQLKKEDYAQLQKFRFFNTVLFENIPQLAIQVLYTYESGSFDIFVLSAMIFSVLSAMISISQQLTRRMRYDPIAATRLHYLAKKTFKVKIESERMTSNHKYCHKTLTKSLCSSLGIDDNGNIEVFYIIGCRNGITAYTEVANMEIIEGSGDALSSSPPGAGKSDKTTLFNKFEELDDKYGLGLTDGGGSDANTAETGNGGDGGSNTNLMLKQEIAERLHLESSNNDDGGGAGSGDGENNMDLESIISNMKVTIEAKNGLSVNTNSVELKSARSIDSPIMSVSHSGYGYGYGFGYDTHNVVKSLSNSPEPPMAGISIGIGNNNNNVVDHQDTMEIDRSPPLPQANAETDNDNNQDAAATGQQQAQQEQLKQMQQQMLQMQMQFQQMQQTYMNNVNNSHQYPYAMNNINVQQMNNH